MVVVVVVVADTGAVAVVIPGELHLTVGGTVPPGRSSGESCRTALHPTPPPVSDDDVTIPVCVSRPVAPTSSDRPCQSRQIESLSLKAAGRSARCNAVYLAHQLSRAQEALLRTRL